MWLFCRNGISAGVEEIIFKDKTADFFPLTESMSITNPLIIFLNELYEHVRIDVQYVRENVV